ncbi:MAG: alanine racemase [Actinomycetota bacterium]
MATVRTKRATARVNLAAIEHNIKVLKETAGVPVLAVVKADGYGHGAVPVALAAKSAGADWLGVAFLDEAFELRNNNVPGPILTWLLDDSDNFAEALDQDIDLSVTSLDLLRKISALAKQREINARVHVEVDTGLSRAGVAISDFDNFFKEFSKIENVELISIWSHLACADEPNHPVNEMQHKNYEHAIEVAAKHGLVPKIRHLANSAGALAHPNLRYDMVRCGIATYGVAPGGDLSDAKELNLKAAMTVISKIATVRKLNAGDGVSYSFKWTAQKPTTVGLIPIGYADGVMRHISKTGSVTLNGNIYPIVGTVCMDQFVVDFGATEISVGDEVVLFGDGGMSAHQWAQQVDAIGYELVTRLGSRIEREYVDGAL